MAVWDDSLQVNYSSVTQLADDIQARRREVKSQLDRLWEEVKRVDDAWEGEAKEMFLAAKQKWDQHAHSIAETLSSMETKVRHGNEDYQSTDKKAAGYFQDFG